MTDFETKAAPVSDRRSPGFWLVGACVFVLYLALVARYNFLTDDAFISFRYSRNLAEGLGLRYNVGVDPPVEGFSNFLWVVWLALFEWLRADITFWSRASSILCGVLLLWRVTGVSRLAQAREGAGLLAWAPALFLATSPAFAAWSTSGLATMPFALAVFLAFEALLGEADRPRAYLAALSMAAIVLIRTDGPVWITLLCVSAGTSWLRSRSKPLMRALLIAGSTSVLVFALYVAWRFSYYDDYMSNTARAKVGFSALRLQRGFNYDMVFLLTYVSVPLVLLAALTHGLRSKSALVLPSLLMVAGFFGYAALMGGDFFCMGRFLMPALPFVALLFGEQLRALVPGHKLGRPLAGAWCGSLLLLSLLPGWDIHLIPHAWRAQFHFRWRVPDYVSEHQRWESQVQSSANWSDLGRALALNSTPEESFVIGRIGAVGYYSRLIIHDRKGLVDREVALQVPANPKSSPGHEKLAYLQFFESREPTYLFAEIRPGARANRRAFGEAYQLRVSSVPGELALLNNYRFEKIELKESDGFAADQWLCRYVRR